MRPVRKQHHFYPTLSEPNKRKLANRVPNGG